MMTVGCVLISGSLLGQTGSDPTPCRSDISVVEKLIIS